MSGNRAAIKGGIVSEGGTRYYRITNYDLMDPFFIAVVGDGDLWLYISSLGSLAAGRRSPEQSFFPYESVDKIHVRGRNTGPLTIAHVAGSKGKRELWEPFDERGRERYELTRNVLKSEQGNEVVFEEINHSLKLGFRTRWAGCEKFGWVRTCRVWNTDRMTRRLDLLDGVQNLLPAELERSIQDTMSPLGDAYKQGQFDPEVGLAAFSLASGMSDRPEALECMRATCVWIAGLKRPAVLLSDSQVRAFRAGRRVKPETQARGRKGAFLARSTVRLAPGESEEWHQVFDIGLDHARLADLRRILKTTGDRNELLRKEIESGTRAIERLLAGADAKQFTGDEIASVHHASNVLFNIARGGVPPGNYDMIREDFRSFLAARDRSLAERSAGWIDGLPPVLHLADFLGRADAQDDPDLARHSHEYLPLVFSRRHGDPSRPWNHFAIHMKNPDGSPRYAYQGNWRDLFQNWEALAMSFPELLESMIVKFVNASTVDGFNPYRISQEGIDWDAPNPGEPWGNLGYWGDHQIVYLLKLLELSSACHPGKLEGLLVRDLFCYADVPYDIKPYAEIVRDPHFTIHYNRERAAECERRSRDTGSDGKLRHENGSVRRANLVEKLLVPVLAKLANLVPGGGIWMNTQRPEWNDANNALPGYGVSVVTLAYLRRHMEFLRGLFARAGWDEVPVSEAIVEWLRETGLALEEEASGGTGLTSDASRRAFLDRVGQAFSRYRERVYSKSLGGRVAVRRGELDAFLAAGGTIADASLKVNRREDGLYHSYSILVLEDGEARISRLPEMLEGQVAILSSGILSGAEAAGLLDTLARSQLFRRDRGTYLLYPEKKLPLFMDRNVVPARLLEKSPQLKKWLTDGDSRVILRDKEGVVRFNSAIVGHPALERALEEARLEPPARASIHGIFEEMFRHREFTGRSGSMYGYEGVGCVYWHMVGKLLLAAQECFFRARDAGEPTVVLRALKRLYRDVRAGMGFTRSPAEFGAFPLDAYSHTPYAGGARQPGMTGLVKEEILSRMGELGVRLKEGRVCFDPSLLARSEFLRRPAKFRYVNRDGLVSTVDLKPGELAFTLCQVPVIVRIAPSYRTEVSGPGGGRVLPGAGLDAESSRLLFERSRAIELIRIGVAREDIQG